MATAKGANTYNRQNWEESDFPILCQTCLGDNPYIRMTKEKYGRECKICQRPFTIFRWCPGARMRFKKTEVCQTCSKLKNVCQTCLLDLEYGLPIQVRDQALNIKDEMPKSDVNKEYYSQNIEREIANTDGHNPAGAVGKAQAPSDLLLKLARTSPYYKRNRPHICSFWVKGECKRGEECPYRHEKPTDPDDPLADQNIKDRFFGVNDPVADKLMRRASTMPQLEAPEDKTITTLYVGGLADKVTEEDLKNHFYQFGEIRSINVVQKQQCAFVTFTNRQATELGAEGSFQKLIIKGRRLNVKWGKSQAQQQQAIEDASGSKKEGGEQHMYHQGQQGALPPPPGLDNANTNFFNLNQGPGSLPPLPGGPPGMLPRGPPPRLPPPPMHMGGRPMPPHGGFGMRGGMRPMMQMGGYRGGPPMHRMRGPPPPPIPPFHGNRHFQPPPGMRPPGPPPQGPHYPSQDPTRMGAGKSDS